MILSLALSNPVPPGTFSIAAYDPETGDLGVAVASRVLAVGSVVPWVKADVGAIATQSYANTTYGPNGLALLEQGKSPDEVMKILTEADEGRAQRQVGIVDGKGRSATYTGDKCFAWAGGIHGADFACQGNILVGKEVVEAMAAAFLSAKGELAERMYAALKAGDDKGGDKRGRQSAAIVVYRKGGGYAGFDDRYVDLRVDDHKDPVGELGRLLAMSLSFRMEQKASRLYERKNWEESSAEYRRLLALDPNNPRLLYNHACVLSLWGKKEAAMAALARAVELDERYRALAKDDPDFEPLHSMDAFQKLTSGG